MAPRKRFKHLMVDLDGTLLDAHNFKLSLAFIRKVLHEMKPKIGTYLALRALKRANSEFKRPSPHSTNYERALRIFAKEAKVSADKAKELYEGTLFKVFPTLEKYFFPVPGAKDFIDWAQEHYDLILATNPVWPPNLVELRLKWAGIERSHFRTMTHAGRMHSCKPHPEYYSELLIQEDLKANDCLLIGNELSMDLPATRIGISVFIVNKKKPFTSLRSFSATAQAWMGSYSNLKEILSQ